MQGNQRKIIIVSGDWNGRGEGAETRFFFYSFFPPFHFSSFQWSKSKSDRNQLKLLCTEKVSLEAIIKYYQATLDKYTDLEESDMLSQTEISGSPDMRKVNENTPLIFSKVICFSFHIELHIALTDDDTKK